MVHYSRSLPAVPDFEYKAQSFVDDIRIAYVLSEFKLIHAVIINQKQPSFHVLMVNICELLPDPSGEGC